MIRVEALLVDGQGAPIWLPPVDWFGLEHIRSHSLELQAEGLWRKTVGNRLGPYLNNAWSRIIGRSSAGSTLESHREHFWVNPTRILGLLKLRFPQGNRS
jgi:hypothetical protein